MWHQGRNFYPSTDLTMKAIIIDDEKMARETLKEFLNDYTEGINVVGMAPDKAKALDLISELDPDLVFLDIEMPNGNGFDLLESLENKSFELIFTTAYGHYAIQAIKYAALDYILKPLDIEELQQAVAKAKEKRASSKQPDELLQIKALLTNLTTDRASSQLVIPDVGGFKVIKASEILYCKSDKSYTEIQTLTERVVSSKSLKEYESLLSSADFFRVNKSFLINLRQVSEYRKGEGGTVIMKDDYEIEVSRRRKQEFLTHFR